MTFDQAKPFMTSTVRHGLTMLAGALVARGAVNSATASGLVEGLSGLVVGLIGYGWSLARAGKLSHALQVICQLIEALPDSSPPPSGRVGSSLDWSNNQSEGFTPTLVRDENGRLLSPQPRSQWPMGGVSTTRETNPGDAEISS